MPVSSLLSAALVNSAHDSFGSRLCKKGDLVASQTIVNAPKYLGE
jgi:hypothetical protein